jgi:hypothetical protein
MIGPSLKIIKNLLTAKLTFLNIAKLLIVEAFRKNLHEEVLNRLNIYFPRSESLGRMD